MVLLVFILMKAPQILSLKNRSLKVLMKIKKIIGIGETGLDFYYNNSEKDKQIASFKEHIEASIKT